MLFQSISLFAFVASALAAPTTNTASTYVSAPAYKAPTYSTSPDSYAVVQTLHTDVYHWTAALNVTRDSYISSTNPKEKAIYVKQLKSEFSGLQQTLTTAQATLKKFGGKKTQHDQDLVVLVQDCVQEIRFTGEGLIPYLGHAVVAPLLIGVVNAVNGLLGALLPIVGGLLGLVFQLLGGVLDLLF